MQEKKEEAAEKKDEEPAKEDKAEEKAEEEEPKKAAPAKRNARGSRKKYTEVRTLLKLLGPRLTLGRTMRTRWAAVIAFSVLCSTLSQDDFVQEDSIDSDDPPYVRTMAADQSCSDHGRYTGCLGVATRYIGCKDVHNRECWAK